MNIVRKCERALIEHPHESRIAPLVGAVRASRRIRRRQEEHVHALDEGAILARDLLAQQSRLDPVGEALGIELPLQSPLAVAVER
jgi:hypothetical protein